MGSDPFMLRVWWLALHPDLWAEHKAECAILGHVPSVERPDTCWWCLAAIKRRSE